MKNIFPPAFHRASHGVALVIILAMIVLLTVLVTAFFSRSILNRQIANSSVSQMKADNLALAAFDTIKGDLKQEMNAGSKADNDPAGTNYTVNGIRIYVPKTNKSVVPARIGTDNTLPNLVRRSVRSDNASPDQFPSQTTTFPVADYTPALLPKNRASASSTTDASANQRAISTTRWNKPLLLSGGSPPAAFVSPDWVIVTRNGPKPFAAWDATLKDGSLTNNNFAIGRYAYTVYDEGGLIDVNLAGYPSNLNTNNDFKGNRGRIGQVNLNDIPGVSQGEKLVEWRNAQTGASADSYSKYVLENTPRNDGFLNTSPGDQTFISRQDLIAYQKNNPTFLTTDALQYLGTFSREKNAPSYIPSPTRPKVQSYINEDSVGNAGSFGKDDRFNPNMANSRRSNGQLRFARRFPLNRLSMLTSEGPATGASTADIKQFFGLSWNSSGYWVYTSPDSTVRADIIKFADNIPDSREPDFFETLQAGIHVGSLGRHSGPLQYQPAHFEPGTSSNGIAEAQNIYYQIIQIGVNIIDQADRDSYPTEIRFGTVEDRFFGIEDLPYLLRIHCVNTKAGTQVSGGFKFEVWNPHQISSGSPSPSNLRVAGYSGTARIFSLPDPLGNGEGPDVAVAGNLVPFSTSPNLREPRLLGQISLGSVTRPGAFRAEIWEGSAVQASFSTQYEKNPGEWRDYQIFKRLGAQMKISNQGNYIYPDGTTANFLPYYHMRVDPRTDRFGTSMNFLPGDGNFGASAAPGETVWPALASPKTLSENHPKQNSIFFYTPPYSYFPPSGPGSSATLGTISVNIQGSNVSYRDPDNVTRPGDAANRSGTDGIALITANLTSRPIILNRPFRTVGELGYVFRDLPFKTLDFTTLTTPTVSSGDQALLDSFSIDDANVIAGHFNLNTRRQEILKAAILGSSYSENANTFLSNADANTIASSIITNTTGTNGPIANRAELVSRLANTLLSGAASDKAIKSRRETVLRSLAESANTRTWNLLVDVVAQSGRYTSAANNLATFQVEGERRYWLHLAIDRYTSEIVSQNLEAINE